MGIRRLIAVCLVFAGLLALSGEAFGDDRGVRVPFSRGDAEEGELFMRLVRGAAVPFEPTVMELPQNCESEVLLHIKWSKSANTVSVHLVAEPGAYEPFPDVDRTQGVDYFPNPFFPEPEDVEDGQYQLWIVGTAGPMVTLYFHPASLDLLGSQFEFDGNPGDAIEVAFPTLIQIASPMFQPEPDGSLEFVWRFRYDHAVRGDRPDLAEMYYTFPPPNLCGANPFRLDLSTLRPWSYAGTPASKARPWSDFSGGGLLFDITVEPQVPYTDPPIFTNAGSYSGGTTVGGTIPGGYTLDIDHAFTGLAPPIKPFAGNGVCEPYTEPVHTKGLNFCQ